MTPGRGLRWVPIAFAVAFGSMTAACGIGTGAFLSPEGCTDKATVDAVLHGVDPTDDRWIWAIDRRTGEAISLRIPGGYGVNTDPVAIVDPERP